ncbi:MAG: lysylphosphatidylglycerol synthase transmembrane domain-containing protein, partial [Gaiellaceae bacterium]
MTPRWSPQRIATRAGLLLLTGVSLYLLLPSLVAVFSSWRDLFELEPVWFSVALGFEALSLLSVWALQRIALRAPSWFAVGTSQLAASAFGRIVPGGMAAAGAIQYRMLVGAGVPPGRVGSALAATSGLLFAGLLALPLLAVPAIVAGTPVEHRLLHALWLGGVVFVLMLGFGSTAFAFDKPLALVGRAVEWCLRLIRRARSGPPLAEVLLEERDVIRKTLGGRWKMAVTASVGKSLFDYLALVATLYAVNATPDPALVVLAYVTGSLLGMVPLTPGGLGFVEAGLTGTLVLAGVDAGQAAAATLAYRLVSFWLPLPAGAVGYWLFRRRVGATP